MGELLHAASEGFAFLSALKYASVARRKTSTDELNLLFTDFGENLWTLDQVKLRSIRDFLSEKYDLSDVKTSL